MKNPKRISAHRPSVQSDRHFTEILADNVVYTNKSNGGISSWDFANRKVYWWVECPENFSSKECFPPEILQSKKSHISHERRWNLLFFGTLVSWEGSILLSWNFQGILPTNRPFYGLNLSSKYHHSICWYIPRYWLKFQ
jgi:hypothetical protein